MTSVHTAMIMRCGLAVGATFAIAFAHVAAGAPGDLDTTFGENGRVWVSSTVSAIAPAPFLTLRGDGASLVLERDRLSLVDATGTVDTSFGYQDAGPANGCPVAPPCPLFRFGRPAFAGNGHILLPFATDNETPPRVGAVRLNANGRRDPGFGTRGSTVRVDADAVTVAPPTAISIQPDGSVLAVYAMRTATGDRNVFMARWREDGSPDLAFGQQGRRVMQFSLDHSSDIVAAFAPDGRIVVGHTGLDRVVNQVAVYRTTVARFLPDGTVDRSFEVFRQEGTDVSNLVSVAIVNDGSIVGAGGTRVGAESLDAFRLHADGRRDLTFGERGIAQVPVPKQCQSLGIVDAAVDAEGRILLLATGAVVRLLPNGVPDSSFAQGGVACIVEGLGSYAGQVAIDSQERIVFSSVVQVSETRGAHAPIYDTRAAVFRMQGGEHGGPATVARRTAVEFVHTGSGHFFVSADSFEVAQLDVNVDWRRTGRAFIVWSEAGANSVPVCRFWSGASFAPLSSHFYTPYARECSGLRAGSVWTYEGEAFFVQLPTGTDGVRTCGADAVPLYRAYNNSASGAPNHRYTTDTSLLDQLMASGWTMEGEAQTRVFACVPIQ